MKNQVTTILVVAFLAVAAQMAAQRRSPNINIGFQLVQPLGEFSEQYQGFPAGIAGSLSIPIARSPIEWGVGYSWNSMGSSDRDIIALIHQDSVSGNVYSEGTLAIRSTTGRYLLHCRFRPLAGKIQPYADAFTGIETFKTATSITLDNSGYSSELATNRDHLDMTYCYGWSLGLRLRVAPGFYIEGRYENITGGKVQYVDDASINVNSDNTIAFDLKESRTNKAVYQLGVAIGF